MKNQRIVILDDDIAVTLGPASRRRSCRRSPTPSARSEPAVAARRPPAGARPPRRRRRGRVRRQHRRCGPGRRRCRSWWPASSASWWARRGCPSAASCSSCSTACRSCASTRVSPPPRPACSPTSGCRGSCSAASWAAMLSAGGAAYQGTFRNPLADPYLLGVAAGAGLGRHPRHRVRPRHHGVVDRPAAAGRVRSAPSGRGGHLRAGHLGRPRPLDHLDRAGRAWPWPRSSPRCRPTCSSATPTCCARCTAGSWAGSPPPTAGRRCGWSCPTCSCRAWC